MQRRKFITNVTTASLLCNPVPTLKAEILSGKRNEKRFVVKAGANRFGEKTKLFGITPNDIKVSGKDTDAT